MGSYGISYISPYFLFTALKNQSRAQDPIIATAKLRRLNPVTPGAPRKLMRKPPSQLPTIPTMIFFIIPMFSFFLLMMLATHPARPPNIIHVNQFIYFQEFGDPWL